MSEPVEDLVMRRSVVGELAADVAERRAEALRQAAYLAAPRVVLADADARLIRVVNVPTRAGRAPRLLSWPFGQGPGAKVHGMSYEPVAKLVEQRGRDAVYRAVSTRAAHDALGLLAAEIEPTVEMPGRDDVLRAVFD